MVLNVDVVELLGLTRARPVVLLEEDVNERAPAHVRSPYDRNLRIPVHRQVPPLAPSVTEMAVSNMAGQ